MTSSGAAHAWLCLATSVCLVAACDRHSSTQSRETSSEGAHVEASASPALAPSAAPALAASALAERQDAAAPLAQAPLPRWCEAFVAQQRPLAAKWADPWNVPKVVGRCYPTKNGAWVIRFDRVKVGESGGLSARFTVEHLGIDGKAVDAPFEPSPFAGQSDAPAIPAGSNYVLQTDVMDHTDVFEPVLFDFDGDGEDELLFMAQAYVDEGTAAGTIGHVFTWRSGTVKLYAPSAKLVWTSVLDIDQDQRPDLIGEYAHVQVAAHSLADGTFSLVDAAAKEFARKDCPKARSAVFLPVDDDYDADAGLDEDDAGLSELGPTGWNGACARLWGATFDAVSREIDQHCAAARCNRRSALTMDVVETAETYRKEVKPIPPLRLDAP